MPAQLSDQLGFSTVTGDGATYVQLPNIPCVEVWFGNGQNIFIAGSATPGSAAINLALGTAAALSWIMVPTGGNANNLFMKSSTAGVVPFMWRNPRAQSVVMGV
jgi:hypothetical protein